MEDIDFSKIRKSSKNIQKALECTNSIQEYFKEESDIINVQNKLRKVLSFDNDIIFKSLKTINLKETETYNLSRLCSILSICDSEVVDKYKTHFLSNYHNEDIPGLDEFDGDKNDKEQVKNYLKKVEEIKKEYQEIYNFNKIYDMIFEILIDNTEQVTIGDDNKDLEGLESTFFNLNNLNDEYIKRFIKDIYMVKDPIISKIERVNISDVDIVAEEGEEGEENLPTSSKEIRFYFQSLNDASYFHSLFAVSAVYDKYAIISKVKSGSGVDIETDGLKSSF